VEVMQIKNGEKRKFPYKSLQHFFQKVNCVAIKVNMVCILNLQAETAKGTPLPDDAEAKPVFIPSKVSILSTMSVPEPTINSGARKAVSSEQDNADDALFSMLEKMNTGDEDEEDEDEEEDEEEDGEED